MARVTRGRKLALLLALLAVSTVLLALWLYLDDFRLWILLRNDFERLGRNAQGYPEYRHAATGIVFVGVPGGNFRMGSTSIEIERFVRETGELLETTDFDAAEKKHLLDGVREQGRHETPQHEVTLSPFLIAKYEVSQSEWSSLMLLNPSDYQGPSLPVNNVSWTECREFCEKAGLALPTESQWEYACRARSRGEFSGTGRLEDMGWFKENSGDRPHSVGAKMPNSFGLHDTHGNVWEWCIDVFAEEYYSIADASGVDPVSRSGSGLRCCRGGGWNDWSKGCRSARRGAATPSRGLGFRPVYPRVAREAED